GRRSRACASTQRSCHTAAHLRPPGMTEPPTPFRFRTRFYPKRRPSLQQDPRVTSTSSDLVVSGRPANAMRRAPTKCSERHPMMYAREKPPRSRQENVQGSERISLPYDSAIRVSSAPLVQEVAMSFRAAARWMSLFVAGACFAYTLGCVG